MKFKEMNMIEKVESLLETAIHVFPKPFDLIPWKLQRYLFRIGDRLFGWDREYAGCRICYARWGENWGIGQDLHDGGLSYELISYIFTQSRKGNLEPYRIAQKLCNPFQFEKIKKEIGHTIV